MTSVELMAYLFIYMAGAMLFQLAIRVYEVATGKVDTPLALIAAVSIFWPIYVPALLVWLPFRLMAAAVEHWASKLREGKE